MEVYIQGKSKADINRRLQAGELIMAKEYSPCGVTLHTFTELPDGTMVKVHKTTLYGEPTPATAYGVIKSGGVK